MLNNKTNIFFCKISLVLIIFFIFYKVYILKNIEGFSFGGGGGGSGCKPKVGVLCGSKTDRLETKAKNLIINLKFILKKYLDLVLKKKDKKYKTFKASIDALKGEYDEEKEKYEKQLKKREKDDDIITKNMDKQKEIEEYIEKKLKRYTKLKENVTELIERYTKFVKRVVKFDKEKFGEKKVSYAFSTFIFLLSTTNEPKTVIEVDEFTSKKAYLEDSFEFFKALVKEAPSVFKVIEKHPLYKNDDFYKLEKKSK
tara:strand:- start:268 stop:1032 length:765 start_codon:yes stop_codon:yes gene_type:complete